MKLNTTEKNALQAVEYLLWATKVKVSSRGLKEDLVMHPDFPSIASISDALTEWQVPNMAVRLQMDQLRCVAPPSIAFLKIRGGIMAPIKSINDHTIEWLDTKRGWQRDSLLDFENKWDGITLLLEPNNKSGEEHYAERSKGEFVNKIKAPFLALAVAICLAIILGLNWSVVQSAGLSNSVLLSIKLIGMVIGGLLLWQGLDTDNPFLQNICRLGTEDNCNSILQSPSSKITPWLGWSEIGFIYFAGGFLGLTFALLSANMYIIAYLAMLSVLAFPYTIYSVWYQGFIARKWCALCMLVQTLLWAETAIVVPYFSEYRWIWSIETLLLLTLAFLLPTIIWIMIKEPFTKASQLFNVQRELQKMKFDESYMWATFDNQKKMPPIFKDMKTAAIGNQNAPHTLTVVTNPLCGPCSRLHSEISLLLKSSSSFQCQFVFLAPPAAWRIVSKFLNSAESERNTLMESWYSDIEQNQEKWMKIHNIQIPSNEVSDQPMLHERWSELAGVVGTPTIYINGIKLPTAFKIKDLKRVVLLLNSKENDLVTV